MWSPPQPTPTHHKRPQKQPTQPTAVHQTPNVHHLQRRIDLAQHIGVHTYSRNLANANKLIKRLGRRQALVPIVERHKAQHHIQLLCLLSPEESHEHTPTTPYTPS